MLPRQEERVGDRCCWLGAVVVEVGGEAVGCKVSGASHSTFLARETS